MCAVAGFFNLSVPNFNIDVSLLDAMQKTLAHRGPDGYKIWADQTLGLGLIHRRLSIMDLSDAGFQPMLDTERSVLVMCNGEIYNHPELKALLQAEGYEYQSHSDTETIVYVYKKWGINGLNKLQQKNFF